MGVSDETSIGVREALLAEAERVAAMGSWEWDVATGRITWSDNLYRLVGYEPGEIQSTVETFFSLVHPDDLARVQAQTQAVATSSDPTPMQYRLVCRDGSVLQVVASGAAVRDDQGHPVRLVGTVIDMTPRIEREQALARSEARLHEAQAIAGVGSFERNLDTDEVHWSPQLRRMLGAGSGAPDLELHVHPDDLAQFREAMRRAELGEAVDAVECRLTTVSGDERHASIRASSRTDEHGARWLTGTAHDITQRVQLEGQLRQSQSLEAVGRLAAGIAHDFNNLLTVIIANASELERRTGAVEASELREIGKSGAELTKRLLAVGRKSPVRPGAVDLARVVDEATSLLSRTLGDQITLETRSAPGVGAVADAHHVQQMLLNLVINARDAMKGTGTIVIETAKGTGQHGATGLIIVRDDGPGMDPETVQRVFEPFFTTKRSGKGTGLGLAMVHGVMSQLNGEVRIASELGKGTAVTLEFRGAEAPVAAPTPKPPAPKAKAARPAPGSQGSVLVIEDEPALLALTARVLRRAGFTVTTADGPAEAIEAYKRQPVDAVVSDLSMPDGGGERVIRELRALRPDLPIVLMTGYHPDGDRFDEPIVTKPFTPTTMVAAMQAAMARGGGG